MNKHDFLLKRGGEILYDLYKVVREKHKTDTFFIQIYIPIIVMLATMPADGGMFASGLKMLTYDGPFTRMLMMGTLLFGFDVCPPYMGVQHKRLKQGFSDEKFILSFAAVSCIAAVAVNTYLNIATLPLYAGRDGSVDVGTKAVALVRIVAPVITSTGSYFISYLCYDPLKIRIKTLECTRAGLIDEIRRLTAIAKEYHLFNQKKEELQVSRDDADLAERDIMEKLYLGQFIFYMDYINDRVAMEIGKADAYNHLSKEQSEKLMETIAKEREAIGKIVSSQTTNSQKGECSLHEESNITVLEASA